MGANHKMALSPTGRSKAKAKRDKKLARVSPPKKQTAGIRQRSKTMSLTLKVKSHGGEAIARVFRTYKASNGDSDNKIIPNQVESTVMVSHGDVAIVSHGDGDMLGDERLPKWRLVDDDPETPPDQRRSPPMSLSMTLAALASAMRDGDPSEVNLRILRADGES